MKNASTNIPNDKTATAIEEGGKIALENAEKGCDSIQALKNALYLADVDIRKENIVKLKSCSKRVFKLPR